MCYAKEVNFIDKTDEEQDQHFFIGTVNSDEANHAAWVCSPYTTSFNIDTGTH
jgi:hypothetical protein